MTNYLGETVKTRLQTDISDSFSVHSFAFNDKEDIQFNVVREFRDYVRKLADSMSVIQDYSKLFALFNINYIKVCFFESNSAADRVGSLLLPQSCPKNVLFLVIRDNQMFTDHHVGLLRNILQAHGQSHIVDLRSESHSKFGHPTESVPASANDCDIAEK